MPWVTLWIDPTKKFSKTTLGFEFVSADDHVGGTGSVRIRTNVGVTKHLVCTCKINPALTFNTSSHPQQK